MGIIAMAFEGAGGLDFSFILPLPPLPSPLSQTPSRPVLPASPRWEWTQPLCVRNIMADNQAQLMKSIDGFFPRSGLTFQDQKDCYHFVDQRFPGKPVNPVPSQGYCSFTVLVGDNLVIQFRPDKYRLNLHITASARCIYGSFAPATQYLTTIATSGLFVYCMDRIQGISLERFRDVCAQERRSLECRSTLCKDFARFHAKGWHQDNTNHIPLGTVGKSISSRLNLLSSELPVRFQPAVQNVLRNISLVEALPWVLSHGDIVAGNVMVEPLTGHLLGLVDWAEAELLPFGLSLYGLEELIGEISATGFDYHQDASDLRALFWKQLIEEIPALQSPPVLHAVKLARDLGVLLWHGIAFDNGAIDRVVQEGRDIDEIYRLDAFLETQALQVADKSSKI